MLGMKTYSQDYIDTCREKIDADLRAYRKQVGKTPSKEFEGRFFNDQILLLDYMFVHRLRTLEGKDGNALNEVRVLCDSILLNQGNLQIEKLPGWPNSAGSSIKFEREKTVLKLKVGQEVKLSEVDFLRISAAFFSELEKKFL